MHTTTRAANVFLISFARLSPSKQSSNFKLTQVKTHVSGSVNIGAGESLSFHYLSRAAATIAEKHPDIHFHITSGDTRNLMDELDNGLIDLAVIFTDVDHAVYRSIDLPARDRFGLLMPKNSPSYSSTSPQPSPYA